MNTAMVISNTPSGRQLVRSDTVAAKVMQKAIKNGRGAEVLAGKASGTGAIVRIEDVEPQDAQSGGSGRVSEVRARVGEVTQALGDLGAVFEDIGSYRSLILVSESATALAFAAHVLARIEAEVEAGVEAEFLRDSDRAEHEGDLYNLVLGPSSLSIRVGTGADELDLVTGAHVQFILSGAEKDEAGSPSAVWEEACLRISFENGDEVVLMNAEKAGSISLSLGGEVLTLVSPKVPAGTGLLDIAV